MRRMSQAMLCLGLVIGIASCRASFQDIQKANLLSSGDDLGAKDEGKSDNANPDYPTLENTKELPPEDSESYNCDGTVIIHEKGKDKNLDGILQPTEVTDISTECKPNTKDPGGKDPGGKDPGGKDPGGKDPGQNPGQSQCPNQSKGSYGNCDDDPGQSGKK